MVFTKAVIRSLAAILAILALLAFCGLACGTRGSDALDAGTASEIERAKKLVKGPTDAWIPREEATRLALIVEREAAKDAPASERAAWYEIAADLVTRAFRQSRQADLGRQATDYLALAAKEGSDTDACNYGAARAALEGEIAKDAYVTYAEAYREKRRRELRAARRDAGAVLPCAAIERMLSVFEGFRPSPAVLEGIEQELSGQPSVKRETPLRVERVEHWSGPEGGRVVIFLTRKATFRVLDEGVGASSKTFVDIDGADSGDAKRNIPMSGLVSAARLEPVSTGTRVSLDLTAPAVRKVFHLVEPFRLVIDVAKKVPRAREGDRRRVSRVVLDPGHGGHDPGATGLAGLREKDVVLAVAQRVAPMLARQGIQVVLTRDDDRFVEFEERCARANAFGADLFLSIHCNASEGHTRRGVETYILDTTSNEIAQRVAARENATSQAASAELASILTNLRFAEQSSLSTRFAELLQRASMASLSSNYPNVTDGGVHPAGFYVLVGARMPAALFETSYISNPLEEQRLATPEYQGRLADGIVNAILAYREGR